MCSAQNLPSTILLVEDESLIRMETLAILEDAGYHVLEAADADIALVLIDATPEIDVVITDVQMPGSIDGLALVELVARHFPHIKSVVTSARTSSQEACNRGAKKFLSKPYTAAAIQSAVLAVLASS